MRTKHDYLRNARAYLKAALVFLSDDEPSRQQYSAAYGHLSHALDAVALSARNDHGYDLSKDSR